MFVFAETILHYPNEHIGLKNDWERVGEASKNERRVEVDPKNFDKYCPPQNIINSVSGQDYGQTTLTLLKIH